MIYVVGLMVPPNTIARLFWYEQNDKGNCGEIPNIAQLFPLKAILKNLNI